MSLFKHILLLEPKPLWVNLPKVLDKETVLADSFPAVAEDAQAFAMHSKVRIVLALDLGNSFENNLGELFFHV